MPPTRSKRTAAIRLTLLVTLLLFANVFVLTLLATDRTNPVAWIAGAVVGLLAAAFGYLQVLPELEKRKVPIANPILAAILMLGLGIELILLWQTTPAPKPTVAMMFVVDTSGAMTEKVDGDVTRFDIALAVLREITSRSSLNLPHNWRGLRVAEGGYCDGSKSEVLIEGSGRSPSDFVEALRPYRASLSGFTSYGPSLSQTVTQLRDIPADVKMIVMLFSSLEQGDCGSARSLAGELQEILSLEQVQSLVCAYSLGAEPQRIIQLEEDLAGIADGCYQNINTIEDAIQAGADIEEGIETLVSATTDMNRFSFSSVYSCPGALPSRLKLGGNGVVLADDPTPVNVRNQPSLAGIRIAQLLPGSIFSVLEGPTCADGLAWFQVAFANGGRVGWLAEGSDVYFVRPLTDEFSPIIEATLTPNMPKLTQDCNVILEDDFVGGVSPNDWFQDMNENNRSNESIISGAYELRLNFAEEGQNESLTWGSLRGFTFRSARVESVIRTDTFSGSTIRTGIWLRYQDANNFLAFLIRENGSFYVGRYQNAYLDLLPWQQSDAIQIGDGAVNTLRVDIVDDEFSFFINGIFVGSITDTTWPEGRFGFFGSTRNPPTSFALDYVRFCEL